MTLALDRARVREHRLARSGIFIGGIPPQISTPSPILTTPIIPQITTQVPPTTPSGAPIVWQSIPPLVPEGHAHWADVNAAQAWIHDAVARSSDAVKAAIDAMPSGAAQDQAVIDLWTSLGNVYRSLNIPPTIDSNYRSLYFDWVGSAVTPGEHQIEWSLAQRIGQLFSDPMPRTTQLAQRALSVTGRSGPFSIQMPLRTNLTQDAQVAHQCMAGEAWNDLCSFASITGGTTNTYVGAGEAVTATNFPWGSLRSNYLADPTYGNNILRIMPASRWFFDMGAILARDLAALGASEVLHQGIANQMLLNLAAASAQHILPDQLQQQAAHLPANFERMKWSNQQRSTVDAFLTTAATVAHLIPGFGTAIGTIILGLKAIADAVPSAVGLPTDAWGRGLPVYEYSSINADGLAGRPNYSMVGPPGYTGAPIHPQAPQASSTSSTSKVLIGVGVAGAALYGANALGLINLGKLFR